jgi:hypothetical protein
MKTPPPTIAMNSGRATAFRARAVSHADRDGPRDNSPANHAMG